MNEITSREYWNNKYAATDELIYTDVVNRFVKEYCEDLKPGKMIDLAGGEGRNSVFFAEKGWQVENIDISNVALTKFLKLAEERGVAGKVFANCADATGFESVLTPVDLGVVGYLQIPMPDLADALYCLIDNIRKGGVLLGVWHSLNNIEEGFGGPQNPDVLPSVERIREMLAEEPLDIEVLEVRDGQVQTTEGLKPSKTLVLKAKKTA